MLFVRGFVVMLGVFWDANEASRWSWLAWVWLSVVWWSTISKVGTRQWRGKSFFLFMFATTRVCRMGLFLVGHAWPSCFRCCFYPKPTTFNLVRRWLGIDCDWSKWRRFLAFTSLFFFALLPSWWLGWWWMGSI